MPPEAVQKKVSFGFQEVARDEKTRLVGEVFSSVAERYDVMNDLMSGGLHRLWKQYFLATCELAAGQVALDLAAGTGDIARGLMARTNHEARVLMSDINADMLRVGRDRNIDKGCLDIDCLLADAERVPLASGSVHLVTIAFGLRNVTDQPRAIREMHRVLKPGGQVRILEFSHLRARALQPLYDWYSFNVLPQLGQRVANDSDSYRYLAESIRRHPDQPTLATMMKQAGFAMVKWQNLSGGLVAIHRGYRI